MKFVTDHGTEICVICHADTGIAATTPIDQRSGYVEGVGQCCAECSKRGHHGF